MDKNRIKGKANESLGRARRLVGELADDPKTQAHGSAQELKGRAQNAYGKAKDAARSASSSRSAHSSRSQTGHH